MSDHQELEDELGRVVEALEAAGHAQAQELWIPFEARTRAHLDTEDNHLLPALFRWRRREARAIVEEHKHIRGRLVQLAKAIAAKKAKLSEIQRLFDELRAHARNEERRMYAWADESLNLPAKEALMAALAASIAVVPRPPF